MHLRFYILYETSQLRLILQKSAHAHKKMYHGTLTMYHGVLAMYHGTIPMYHHGTLVVYHGTFSYGCLPCFQQIIMII